MRDEQQRIDTELRRLVVMMAVGNGSPAIMAAINEREARLREIMKQVIDPGPGTLQEKLDDLRDFAIAPLNRLREVLMKPEAIHEARALLAEHVGMFTLERVSEDGRLSYKANGMIDFFGDDASTQLSGARGAARTNLPQIEFRVAA